MLVYRRPMPSVTTGRTQFNQLEGTFTRGHVGQFSSFAKHFSERVSVGVRAPAPCRPFHVTHNQGPVTAAMGGPLRENRFLRGVWRDSLMVSKYMPRGDKDTNTQCAAVLNCNRRMCVSFPAFFQTSFHFKQIQRGFPAVIPAASQGG